MIPSFHFKGVQQVRTSSNYMSTIEEVIKYHPIVHSLEIITDSKNLKPLPNIPNFRHVLLKDKVFHKEQGIDILFNPSTIFISLSPLKTGNTMLVRNGVVTFVLNNATYQRFGLVGRQYENYHIVTIMADKKELIKRIRPCEHIEGLLYTEISDEIDDFLEKYEDFPLKVDGWSTTKSLDLDISLFSSEETYPTTWKQDLMDAIDESLLSRNQIGRADQHRITIVGPITLPHLTDWLKELGKDSFVLAMIWDFRDSISSFVGKNLTAQGLGGGCEALFYGDKIAKAAKIQTIEYINEE